MSDYDYDYLEDEPVSKCFITIVGNSPNWGYSPSKWLIVVVTNYLEVLG